MSRLVSLFAACMTFACASEMPQPTGDRSDEASPYVGLWVGLDAEQSDCQVEVLSYMELEDGKIVSAETDLASRELTRMRRMMQLKVSFQQDQEVVFEAVSTFDEQEIAYRRAELQASHAIANSTDTETLSIAVDPTAQALTGVTYTMGDAKQCSGLSLMAAGGTAPGTGDEPPAEPIEPYGKGRPRPRQ